MATEPGNDEYRDLLKKLVTNKAQSREGGDRLSKSHTRGSEYGNTRNYFSNTQLPRMIPLQKNAPEKI